MTGTCLCVFVLFTVCLAGFTVPWHSCGFFRSCHSCFTEQVRRQEHPAARVVHHTLLVEALDSLRRVLCEQTSHFTTRSCLRFLQPRIGRLTTSSFARPPPPRTTSAKFSKRRPLCLNGQIAQRQMERYVKTPDSPPRFPSRSLANH
jgi:hypothetical protein